MPPSGARVGQLNVKTQMKACKGLQMVPVFGVMLQEILPEEKSHQGLVKASSQRQSAETWTRTFCMSGLNE